MTKLNKGSSINCVTAFGAEEVPENVTICYIGGGGVN